jgi:excisionase family DNA binding protein
VTAGSTNGATPTLMTAEQVAARVQLPKSWVYEQARTGRIPVVKLGRYYRFRAEAVDAWIVEHEEGPGTA